MDREKIEAGVRLILEGVGEDLGVQVIIQREDVFQYMYKI